MTIKKSGDTWVWIKLLPESSEYLVIPKEPEYINMDVLSAALNGKTIYTLQEKVIEGALNEQENK